MNTNDPAGEGVLSVADIELTLFESGHVDTLRKPPAEPICSTEALPAATEVVTHYRDSVVTDGILPMPSPMQRRYRDQSYYVAMHPFLPFHSQAYLATVGRMPSPYERATADSLWDAFKRMPTSGKPVAFTAISAATGGGKTVGACALMAHLVFTVGGSCAYVTETIEGAEEARKHLEILLPGRVACYTSIHRANARPEKVRDYASMNVIAGEQCTEDQFKAAQVVVCTHERWKHELTKNTDAGVRRWKGKLRTLVVVDEEPQLQVTYVQQPEDVTRLLSVLSDRTLASDARAHGFAQSHVAAPALVAIVNRMMAIKANANVPQLYAADLVSADDLEYISQVTRADIAARLPVDEMAQVDTLSATVEFLKAASQGRVFYSKADGGEFHAYAFSLPVQPRHIVLDGTADLNGWNAVGSHMAIVESEKANYERLQLFAVRPPKEFRNQMRPTGTLRDVYRARPYVDWLLKFIEANTAPGEQVLVYAKKALLNFGIHKEPENDTLGGTDRLLSHYAGRVIHWSNFGKGRGINKWKDCTAYFRCGDFHIAKGAAVSRLGSVTGKAFNSAELKNLSSSSTRHPELRLVMDTHIAVTNKQDTARICIRRLDDDGKCMAGRAYMIDCNLPLLTKYRERMFPGSEEYALVGYEGASKAGATEDGAAKRVATFLLSTELMQLTVTDLESACGLRPDLFARTLRTAAVMDAMAARGWTETSRKALGLPGKGKVLVRS